MIKQLIFYMGLLFFGLSFAETTSLKPAKSDMVLGYALYVQNCTKCHDLTAISPLWLKEQMILAPMEALSSGGHENKGKDLSLLYKQTDFTKETLEAYLNDFYKLHGSITAITFGDNDGQNLLYFIDEVNNPHQFTAYRLGILSLIYLSVLLIFWLLWAIKLQHRVTRRYDRYDIPSFPKKAPENFTKASNDT